MHHVIIGAGPAGVVAAEILRATDADCQITLLGDEHPQPYSRMAIPYYLAGHIPEAGMHLRKESDHFKKLKIDARNVHVKTVDAKARKVTLEDGKTLTYDKLLVATGSRPLQPPIPGIDLPGVHPCWTIDDARAIHKLAKKGKHALLIGAGFIGSIILNSLVERGAKMTVVEVENRMVPRMLDETAGGLLKRWCETKGIRVATETKVESIAASKKQLAVKLSNGETVTVDVVIVATGVRPQVEFLKGSGVKVDQGILVNDRMQSSVPEIYAAGDVAQGVDFSDGGQAVHPIQPTATEHGRVAALNMAGVDTRYQGSLIMNVLDTVGLVSYSFGQWMGVSGGQTVETTNQDAFRYLRLVIKDDRLVGATCVGLMEHVGIVRGLIQSKVTLGGWREILLENPTRIVEAYMGRLQSGAGPAYGARMM